MSDRNSEDGAAKILLTVELSDSAYFAGEELCCQITLRNVPTHRRHHSNGKIQFGALDLWNGISSGSAVSQVTNAVLDDSRQRDDVNVPVTNEHDSTRASTSNDVKASRHVSFAGNEETNGTSPTTSTADEPPIQINVRDRQDDSPISDLHIRTKDLMIDSAASNPTSPLSKVPATPQSPVTAIAESRGTRSERLMMGFVQIVGSFTVDESLVHSDAFQEVRNAALVGGKLGGGVVGVDFAKQQHGSSGLMNSLYGGLGGLFGSTHKSSLADMKLQTDSKSVPIISTVPSLLFVDLSLEANSIQTFSYKFKLPSNIPPTHRGVALHISYRLILTIQRANAAITQPKTIELPFRIFAEIPSKLLNVELY